MSHFWDLRLNTRILYIIEKRSRSFKKDFMFLWIFFTYSSLFLIYRDFLLAKEEKKHTFSHISFYIIRFSKFVLGINL